MKSWNRLPGARALPSRACLAIALGVMPAGGCSERVDPDAGSSPAETRRAPADALDRAALESLSGATGIFDRESGAYRLAIPREDLLPSVDGLPLGAGLGFGGWVAFEPVPGGAVVTAELPMLADEINPVISAALLHGLRVTSLHGHYAQEEPRLWFLHLVGIGETDSLAAAMGAVLQTLDDVKGQPHEALPTLESMVTTLDAARVDSVLGLRGEMREGTYRITIPRATRLEGYALGPRSGIETRAAFVGSDERAVVTGRFALLESELQGVLRALRAGGVDIVSIGDPLVGEEPRLVFVHYWGRGRAVDLARAIRDALDASGSQRPTR